MNNINAINKWFYFSMNYKSDYYDWTTMYGEKKQDYLPTFIMEVKWACSLDHIIGKWNYILYDYNGYARMNKFYGELDSTNRKLLLEWVLENYNDDPKIIKE